MTKLAKRQLQEVNCQIKMFSRGIIMPVEVGKENVALK